MKAMRERFQAWWSGGADAVPHTDALGTDEAGDPQRLDAGAGHGGGPAVGQDSSRRLLAERGIRRMSSAATMVLLAGCATAMMRDMTGDEKPATSTAARPAEQSPGQA